MPNSEHGWKYLNCNRKGQMFGSERGEESRANV